MNYLGLRASLDPIPFVLPPSCCGYLKRQPQGSKEYSGGAADLDESFPFQMRTRRVGGQGTFQNTSW